MVVPCKDEGLYSGEGDFRDRMIQYIRENFSELLGNDVELLDRPDGLDLIQARYGVRKSAVQQVEEELAKVEADGAQMLA